MNRWERATSAALARVEAQATDPAGGRFSPERAHGLPQPVARYFTFALTAGQPLVRTARITHEGEFRIRPGARPSRFTSVQYISSRPPGFVWDARIEMLPLLPVRVRDAYLSGQGSILGGIAGVIALVNRAATPELGAGALCRWLAEAVWLPTALLPGNGITWDPVDSASARATLTDAGRMVTMDVAFGDDGRIERISADRYRDVKGRGILTPWQVSMGDYEQRGGMMIPIAAEVAWLLAAGPFTYWRGRIDTVQYRFVGTPDGERAGQQA